MCFIWMGNVAPCWGNITHNFWGALGGGGFGRGLFWYECVPCRVCLLFWVINKLYCEVSLFTFGKNVQKNTKKMSKVTLVDGTSFMRKLVWPANFIIKPIWLPVLWENRFDLPVLWENQFHAPVLWENLFGLLVLQRHPVWLVSFIRKAV